MESSKNITGLEEKIGVCPTNMQLNSVSTIEWLKRRFNKTTKIQYLNNPTQLQQHKAIWNVFNKLDEDGSNSLDIDEVNQMFVNNNISVTYDQLKALFCIGFDNESTCKSGTYELSFEQFKAFTLSEKANKMFRKIVKEIRKYEIYKHPEKRAGLLPYNFSTLLNYLSEKEKKETLREEIFNSNKVL